MEDGWESRLMGASRRTEETSQASKRAFGKPNMQERSMRQGVSHQRIAMLRGVHVIKVAYGFHFQLTLNSTLQDNRDGVNISNLHL